jgi:hypothetical protein
MTITDEEFEEVRNIAEMLVGMLASKKVITEWEAGQLLRLARENAQKK